MPGPAKRSEEPHTMTPQNPTRHVFRFFGSRVTDSLWRLDDAEAHHALKVLRLPPGEAVEVMDGMGAVARGTLKPTGKESADVDVIESRTEPAEPAGLELAMGALKPGDLDEILPALVELGMTRISIFINEQSGKSRVAEKSLDRWQRIIDASVKQSKRCWRPAIATYGSMEEWLLDHRALNRPAGEVRWIFAEPGLDGDGGTGKTTPAVTALTMAVGHAQRPFTAPPPSTIGLVGSEKGFSPSEVRAALDAGFFPVSLGPHVLRARTAAIAAATMLAMAGHAPR